MAQLVFVQVFSHLGYVKELLQATVPQTLESCQIQWDLWLLHDVIIDLFLQCLGEYLIRHFDWQGLQQLQPFCLFQDLMVFQIQDTAKEQTDVINNRMKLHCTKYFACMSHVIFATEEISIIIHILQIKQIGLERLSTLSKLLLLKW